MWKKLLILSLSITLLFCITSSMTPVDAKNFGHRSIPINWLVAGSTIDVQTYSGPQNQVLVFLKAVGSPGRADLTVMGYAGEFDSISVDGCDHVIPFDGDEFVAVFTDLSMLFATLSDDEDADSYVCISEEDKTFKFDMKITGGTGRFDGAIGYFTATGVSHSEYLLGGALGTETGEFIGRIEFDY